MASELARRIIKRIENDTLTAEEAIDAELAEVREALKSDEVFMQYARYELEEKHAAFEQFPCQECCDKRLAVTSAALTDLEVKPSKHKTELKETE